MKLNILIIRDEDSWDTTELEITGINRVQGCDDGYCITYIDVNNKDIEYCLEDVDLQEKTIHAIMKMVEQDYLEQVGK